MSEINVTPLEYFQSQQDKLIPVNIAGIDTYILEKEDSHGKYLAIPATDKSLSNICCTHILGHYIKEISYDHYNGNVVIIKAYYL